ncbi:hypothetical protein [Nocardiopsis lambiniae]|uniref:Uncharacterized protein n=1 Tax=Nocardiopsis lambiniae TaxID=3075539 RepID=A0ABU2MCN3_9ACTN|nr:hypothetical protein [Nocardiopsis sp. DSM 44743]MDT0330325.1 hypothetical protein [Nocardiopsis sp. DSM 44743]
MDPKEQAEAVAARTLEGTRERLAGLEGCPTAGHVEVFDSLHRELSGVLGALDQEGDRRPPVS